ncbi:BA14K family protein [Pseudochelatococcus sp. B33]
MHVLTHKPFGSSPVPPPLWRRVARAGLVVLPALAMSFLPLAHASAQSANARPVSATVQNAGFSGSGDLPIVNVQYRRHGPPPGFHRRHGPPRGYYGPPRHFRGHYPPPRWHRGPPRGAWVPAPPPRYYYHGPRRHSYNPGAAAAAGVVGLAAGAILGSALAQGAPPPRSDSWLSYCASKYRSFDPATGTYLGYDGRRHPCR